MNGIINWLRSNNAFIVTLHLHGNPAGHMQIFREDQEGEGAIAPFQQWIFDNVIGAQEAAQGIVQAIMSKAEEKNSKLELKVREDIIKNSRDVVLCLDLHDTEDDAIQYRLHVTSFKQKPNGEWI
jgi:hypothetical protein